MRNIHTVIENKFGGGSVAILRKVGTSWKEACWLQGSQEIHP